MGFEVLNTSVVPPLNMAPPNPALLYNAASAPLIISDSYPTLYSTLWLNRCPEPGLRALGNMALNCSVIRNDGSESDVHVAVLPATSGFNLEASCSAAMNRSRYFVDRDAQQVNVPVVIALTPAFTTTTGQAKLTCSLRIEGSGIRVVNTSVPLIIRGTHWPLAVDVISLVPGSTENMTWTLVGSINSSAASAELSNCGRVPTYADRTYGECALGAILDVADNGVIPTEAPPPFQLTMTSTTLIILRAVPKNSFSRNSSVYVGGMPAVVVNASEDGRWLAFFTPAASTMCGGVPSTRCRPATLTVSTPADDDALGTRGAALDCPSFCAGDLARLQASSSTAVGSSAIVLYSSDGYNFTYALEDSIASGRVAPLQQVTSSPGIQYLPSCTAEGYTDPASGVCVNESVAASSNCAYGNVGECSKCPSNALCPGGKRMWPRAGYFAFSEFGTSMQACPEPNPSSRCIRWDPDEGVTVCGQAYRQGSYLCEACGEYCRHSALLYSLIETTLIYFLPLPPSRRILPGRNGGLFRVSPRDVMVCVSGTNHDPRRCLWAHCDSILDACRFRPKVRWHRALNRWKCR